MVASPTPAPSRQLEFAAAVFVSAFLLMLVQPVIGKYLLPWFGGTPAVWTVCLLFFQALLFLGYAYAHALVRFLRLRPQVMVHATLLLAALAILPITPREAWQPPDGEHPVGRLLVLLARCVGLPYFALAATSPLLQSWFSRTQPQQTPYRLYAVSNLGSLLGLLVYPFVVEPALTLDRQTLSWSWIFGGFGGLCGLCGWRAFRQGIDHASGPAREPTASPAETGPLPWSTYAFWFALAMVPSVMLLAVTDQMCTDVAVVPLLWLLPLALYLISFILCFHSPSWRPRGFWAVGWGLAVVLAIPMMVQGLGVQTSLPIPIQIAVFAWLLLTCAMVCHGELARRQPAPTHLTAFYLTMSGGGVAGGLFVGILAPLLFGQRAEVSLAMGAGSILLLVVLYQDRTASLGGGRPRPAWLALLVGLGLQISALWLLYHMPLKGVEIVRRNFYGVLQVRTVPVPKEPEELIRQLIHGRTMHGSQFTNPLRASAPTTYYGPDSGVGLLLRAPSANSPRRIGVVGLGTGTLATYGRDGDYFRFYEINPAVIEFATSHFQYLADCAAQMEFVSGDARLQLEHEAAQDLDVLVVDAFSSDAIPVHLLTREAFGVYLRHLARDGLLAVHISNAHLDLRPVVAANAHSHGTDMITVFSDGNASQGLYPALWCLLSRDPTRLHTEQLQAVAEPDVERHILWTDQRNSLFDVLKLGK